MTSLQTELTIPGLIDRLQTAAGERSVPEKAVKYGFAVEEPIAWVRLLGLDAVRYFEDPAYYLAQTLRQMIWRLEQVPEDKQPPALHIPIRLGHYPEYTFLGLDVRYDAAGVPAIQTDHPLSRQPDLSLLPKVNFASGGVMPRALRFYDEVRELTQGRLPVHFEVTWWRGCLDLAIQLRGYEAFLEDTVERPDFVHGLLRYLVEERCRWHESYCHYFELPLSEADIGDDWLNIPFITPYIFSEFVLPRYLDIEQFHGGVRHIHSCGNQTPIQKDLSKIQSLSEFEVSPWSNLAQSLVNLPPDKRLVIGLHPNDVLCASTEQMTSRLEDIRRQCAGRDYAVMTSGLTPLEGEDDYVRRIRSWLEVAKSIFEAEEMA